MYRSRSYPQVALRPQDLVVLLRLSLEAGVSPSYAALASELFLTASEIHAGLERAAIAQLVRKDSRGKVTLVREALRSFVLHGARYAFPAVRGEVTRGMPTAHAAAPLNGLILAPAGEPLPVWPYKNGTVRGATFHPLYPTVPQAAERNPALHARLALFDAIRGGSPRERALAMERLEALLTTTPAAATAVPALATP